MHDNTHSTNMLEVVLKYFTHDYVLPTDYDTVYGVLVLVLVYHSGCNLSALSAFNIYKVVIFHIVHSVADAFVDQTFGLKKKE